MASEETTGLLTVEQREALERVGVDGRATTWYDVLTAIGVTTRGFDAAADLRRRFLDADDRARERIAAARAEGVRAERARCKAVVQGCPALPGDDTHEALQWVLDQIAAPEGSDA